MAKAEQKFRMAWENDIPVCKGVEPNIEWKDIPWRKLEKRVHKLQKRIYQASSLGNVKLVRKLQKTLMRSWSARCLAVRKVTQDNKGKKTAGVDGIKALTPNARFSLINKLKLSSKVKPTRRVWIPKPGTDEKRPLGIPTMYDRALQALVKLALEPEWEAKFEPNSYGFRPGRSCHDAIQAIFNVIKLKAKYVLDADIAKCFDRIDHKALLEKLNTFPTLRRQVRAWLKAGVMDNGQLQETSEGTPQGGIISPLLANIALHGMENRIKEFADTLDMKEKRGRQIAKAHKRRSLSLIRYADDFVILHEDITVVQRCQQIIAEWLSGIGLELKPSKTRITHTLESYNGEKPGFNFLGFNIRQYHVGKYSSGKVNGKLLGFKTLITPSKEKVEHQYRKIVDIINAHKSAPQMALINHLNPVIRGWANYYSTQASTKAYEKLDNLIYNKLVTWGKDRHPNKSLKWIHNKYWKTVGNAKWVFSDKAISLIKYAQTPIVRDVPLKCESSPYNGDMVYWSNRMGDCPELPQRIARLIKVQKGKCNQCGLHFKNGEVWEIDHKEPLSKGGSNKSDNLQLLHRHCHDTKTRLDGSRVSRHLDKSQVIEEPCDAKVSCTVLKPSKEGDFLA